MKKTIYITLAIALLLFTAVFAQTAGLQKITARQTYGVSKAFVAQTNLTQTTNSTQQLMKKCTDIVVAVDDRASSQAVVSAVAITKNIKNITGCANPVLLFSQLRLSDLTKSKLVVLINEKQGLKKAYVSHDNNAPNSYIFASRAAENELLKMNYSISNGKVSSMTVSDIGFLYV